MDFVSGGSLGLERSISNLQVAMQDLASLDVSEYWKVLQASRPSYVLGLIFGIDLLTLRGPMWMERRLTKLQLTCKGIKDMLGEWEAGWPIWGTAKEARLDALDQRCYDIEDVVDDLRLGVSRPVHLYKVFKIQVFLERLSFEIERVIVAVQGIPTEIQSKESSVPFGLVHPDFVETLFVGRDQDKHAIIDMLLSENSHHLGVSIIGMEGFGKTSLAAIICADYTIQRYFGQILTASVSSHFKMEEVVKKLVAYGSKPNETHQRSHPVLGDRLKHVLIVLDDVWSVMAEEWEKFEYHLNISRSCRIITTSPNPKVAEVTGTVAYNLTEMTEEVCYHMITKKAKLDRFQLNHETWASDVNVIAHKCQGMASIANMFGRTLSRTRSLHECLDSIVRFKNIELWELPEFRQVLTSLRLNVSNLPPHTKKCLAYFSLFSPKHQFQKNELIQLWEAEGFVRPQHKIGWQPTGSQCFDDLLSRSILRPLQSSYTETQPLYEMHIFNYKVATLLASKAFLRVDGSTTDNLSFCKSIRHLSLSNVDIDALVSEQINKCKGLRTFLLNSQIQITSLTFLRKLQSLRLLDLSSTNIRKLPLSVRQLQHLRYLDLSGSDIESLPEPIYPLCALQTLKLQHCSFLKKLPNDLNKLINLVHLYVDFKLLRSQPSKLGMLANLETLTSYVVTRDEGSRIAELMNMKYIREIDLFGLEDIWNREEAEKSMLRTKHFLKRLGLIWDHGGKCSNCEEVLEGLEPHNELEELKVENYCSREFPKWLSSPYRKLVSVRLTHCYECEVLPSLGQLPFLKNLVLTFIYNVEYVDTKFQGECRCAFPCLESLELNNMIVLHKWDGLEERDMPCLRDLRIISCPMLIQLPNSLFQKSCLKHLKICNCPKLRLDIPSELEGRGATLKIIDSPYVKEEGQVGEVCASVSPVKEFEDEIMGKDKGMISDDNKMELQKSPELYVAFQEETLDKQQAEVGQKVNYPTAGVIHNVSQYSSKETAPAIPAAKHHPDTDATVLKNPDIPFSYSPEYEERLGVQVLEPAKELEAKKVLFLLEKGCEFEKIMIIQLWMALGLLMNEPMERTGAAYFEKLVSEEYMICSDVACSLYKVNTEKLNTELDNNLIEKQNYIILDNGSRIDEDSAQTWHASVVCDEVDASMFKTLAGFNSLRTLLFLGNYGSRLQQLPRDLFLCHDSLVTLALSGAHIKELPSSAVKLVNLRYLDLSWTFVDVLPERIDRFEKLQTLKLAGCTRLRRLPQEIAGLIELRHLHLDVLRQLSGFPKRMGALVNMRTLSAFPVGTEEGLKIIELKHLNNIMGKFCIANMENVQSTDEAKEASLEDKRDIKKLELRWSDHQYEHPRDDDESILENLRPHSDLEEIQILCFPGSRIPDWISDVSFHKLVGVTLFRCVHLATIPSLGKLPSLVSLELISLNNVATIEFEGEVDDVTFPKLEKLAVYEMLNVQAWKEAREGDYACLVEITIKDCPKLPELSSLPYLPSAKHLELTGCTKLAFVSEKELSTSLQQLIVEDCPIITERCSKKGGQDWHKIKNITTIWIDQVAIQPCEVDDAL